MPNTQADFWRQVSFGGGCWLWTGTRPSGRYGRFKICGQKFAAHRYAWTIKHGAIPAGFHVLHHCDQPACVRPSHLFLGTHADNMADKALKGRVVCKVGEANHLSRISANVALSIRHAVDGGMSQVDAAKKFGIGQTQVSRLVRGDAWASVGGPIQPRRNAGRKPKESQA